VTRPLSLVRLIARSPAATYGPPPATPTLWHACGRGLGNGQGDNVGDAAAGDGAYCDGCDNSITTGLVYDVVLTPYGASKGRVAVLREACFEDLTSGMDVARAPGGEFLVLVEPWFL
jgi:hypothetical protein